MICGLPQCEEFVKRQRAVQFAVRQTCANNAEAQFQQASLYHGFALVLYLLGGVLLLWSSVATGFRVRGTASIDFGLILFVMLGAVCLFAGSIVRRVPARLISQARNWEDVSREFEATAPITSSHEDEINSESFQQRSS